MKRTPITLLAAAVLLLLPASIMAQFVRSTYNWSKEPQKVTLTELEQKEPAVYLKNYRFIEYAYTDAQESDVAVYQTIHRHVRINSDDAIQSFNKVYIPMRSVLDLVSVKARTISPKGEVKELDKSAIKEQTDEDGSVYRIFALEGIEKGSEIEYIYTVKKNFVFYGRETFQSGTYSRDSKFELVSPSNLIFVCKGYNSFPAIKDTTIERKNYLTAAVENIPRLREEKYGDYNANLMRVDYRLEFNTARNRAPLFTWAAVAQDVVKKYSDDGSKDYQKEVKKIKSLIKDLGLDKLEGEEAKIKALEKHLKETVAFVEDKDVENNVEFVLKNRYADDAGLLRIYALTYTQLNIPYEIVFTNDRSNTRFDPEFVSYNQLQQTLLYFPNTKKYMIPTNFQYRYGIIPYEYTNNYGLFIKTITVGELVTGLAEPGFIEPLAYNKSVDNLDITMKMDETSDKLKVDIIRAQSGYYAAVFPLIPLLKDEDKTNLKESLFKSLIEDAEIKSVEFNDKDFSTSIADTTYKLTASLVTGKLVERAGNNILFKIGEAIGPQDQLYQEEERKTNVENSFNRLYHRTLRFTIPEGYRIKNADDLKLNIVISDKGTDAYGFVSTYKIEGSQLVVDVNEYYKQLSFPKERFEEFRKVINAAADFNKIVLVLEKN